MPNPDIKTNLVSILKAEDVQIAQGNLSGSFKSGGSQLSFTGAASDGDFTLTITPEIPAPSFSDLISNVLGDDVPFIVTDMLSGVLNDVKLASIVFRISSNKNLGPFVTLTCVIPDSFKITDTIAIDAGSSFEISTYASKITDQTCINTSIRFESPATVMDHALTLSARNVNGHTWDIAVKDKNGQGLPGLDALGKLLQIDGLSDTLTTGLQTIGAGNLVVEAICFRIDMKQVKLVALDILGKVALGNGVQLNLQVSIPSLIVKGELTRTSTIGLSTFFSETTFDGFELSFSNLDFYFDLKQNAFQASGSVNVETDGLSTLTKPFLGNLTLPTGLPAFERFNISLSISKETKIFYVNGGSSGWTMTLGSASAEVSNVGFELTHTNSDGSAETSGTVSGIAAIGDVTLQLVWDLKEGFSMTGHIPSVDLGALAQDLAGKVPPLSLILKDKLTATLENADIQVAEKDSQYQFALATQVKDFGTVMLKQQSNPSGVAVGLGLPDGWKLSDISGFPKDLDGVVFNQNLLIASTFDGVTLPDKATFGETTLPDLPTVPSVFPNPDKGVTFFSVIDFKAEFLADVVKLLNVSTDTQLQIAIHIGFDPVEAALVAAIPCPNDVIDVGGVKINKPQLELGVGGTTPYLGVGGTVEMDVDGQSITVDGRVGIVGTGAEIQATYEGNLSWAEIFGIHARLTLKKPSVDVGFGLPGLPIIGLSGDYTIEGGPSGKLAVKFNFASPAQSMISGSFSEIAFGELITTFTKDTVTLPADVQDILSHASLSDATIYIAPQQTVIGTNTYEKGYSFSGTVNLGDMSGTATINLDPDKGAKLDGGMEKPLTIGSGLTIGDATGEKGPQVNLSTYAEDPHFNVSGLAQVGDVLYGTTSVAFSSGKYSFTLEATVFTAFSATVKAVDVAFDDLSSVDLDVSATLNADKLQTIVGQINGIETEAANAASAISNAKTAVGDADTKLNQAWDSATSWIDDQISAKKTKRSNDISSRDSMQRVGNTSYGSYVTVTVKSGYIKWDGLKSHWVPAKTRSEWRLYITTQPQIDLLNHSISDLDTQIRNLQATKDAIKSSLSSLSKALQDNIASAQGALSKAQSAFEDVNTTLNQTLARVNTWLQSNADLVKIKTVTIDTKLSALNGPSFDASVDLTLMGEDHTYPVTFDPTKLDDFLDAIANKAIGILKGQS